RVIGRAQYVTSRDAQHHAASRRAGRHHRLYSEPQMNIGAPCKRASPPGLHGPISSRNRSRQWQTSTGIFVCVSTLVVTLPSTIAAIPLLPCEAMKMGSQPLFLAVL